jgi:hypothetical protein
MDLNEYLLKSKEKRDKMCAIANRYINKPYNNLSRENSFLKASTEDLFPSPNPRRLQVFEDSVNNQLKKYFSPSYNPSSHDHMRLNPKHNINDQIKRVYLNKSQFPKHTAQTPTPRIPSVPSSLNLQSQQRLKVAYMSFTRNKTKSLFPSASNPRNNYTLN